MKFIRKKTTFLVVLLALVSLLGLAVAQLFVVEETLAAGRILFEQKLGLIKQNISEAFRADAKLAHELEFAMKDPLQQAPRMEAFNRKFKKLMDSVFHAGDVSIDYQYAIYSHASNDAGFIKDWSNIENGDFAFDACKHYAQANLTCGMGYSSSYHLAMFFPNEKFYLFSQSGKPIWISMVFIGMIMMGFIYTIATIRKQRKLSDLKNDFINNLTHEFKTPIFSIGVALKTIRKSDELKNADKFYRYIDVIENENERLKNQVDKILQLALVQSGNFLLEKKPFNIHQALERIVNSFKLSIEERDARVLFQLNARHSSIKADETHLSNVFYNLLDNALKFSGHCPQISISTFDHSPDRIGICISDNGVGIGRDIEQFIFDKFFHNPSRLGVSGFGLGLYYARTVVESHHGTMEVRSEVGKGSEFYIYLPNQ